MSKVSEQNNRSKLNNAIIISVVLHIIIVSLLVCSIRDKKMNFSNKEKNSDIGAIMINPINMIEQSTLQKNQQISSYYVDQKKQKQEMQNVIIQDSKQKSLKETGQNHLQTIQQVLEKQQEQIEQKNYAEKMKKQKKEQQKNIKQEKKMQKQEKNLINENKQVKQQSRTPAETKIKQVIKEKEKTTQQVKTKDLSKEIVKTDVKKKAETEKIIDNNTMNNLLSGLLLESNISETMSQSKNDNTIGGPEKSNAPNIDVDNYLSQVKEAIKNRFYDADIFKGRTCVVRIKLDSDGLLISTTAINGDEALCQAAIHATRTARIPNPPSQDTWKEVKDILLEFRP